MPIINVVGGTNFLGYYTSLVELQTAYPTGEPGDWAIVDGDPAAVYAWSEVPTPGWENSGTAGSITSVFGRPGPNIVAVAGDYNASQIADNNDPYPAAADLLYGTRSGMDPAAHDGWVDTTLSRLAADAHYHPNLANIDTINQNLRTNSDVTFKSVTIDTATTGGEVTLLTLDHGTFNSTFTVDDAADTLKLNLLSSQRFAVYGQGHGELMYFDGTFGYAYASKGMVVGRNQADLYAPVIQLAATDYNSVFESAVMTYEPRASLGADSRLRWYWADHAFLSLDERVSIGYLNMAFSDDAALQVVASVGTGPTMKTWSAAAAGTYIDIAGSATVDMMKVGSRLAINGTDTKFTPMIQGYGTMYIDATGDLYIQNCVRANDLYMIVDNANTAFGFRVNNTRTALNGLDIQEPAATSRIWSAIVSPVTADPSIGLNTYSGDKAANIITLTDQKPLNLDVYFGSVGLTQAGDVTQRLRTYTRGSGAAVWAFSEAASLYAEATETHTTSNHGMKWVFEAAPAGGGNPVEMVTIKDYGLGINSDPSIYNLNVAAPSGTTRARVVGPGNGSIRLSADDQAWFETESPNTVTIFNHTRTNSGNGALQVDTSVLEQYIRGSDGVTGAANGAALLYEAVATWTGASHPMRAVYQFAPVGSTVLAPVLTMAGAGISLAAGATVNNIQTAITDLDTAIPTSGAVIDYLGTAGYVKKTGTPVDNQIAVWTAADTVEGTSNFTYDGSVLTVVGAFVTKNGAQTVIDVQATAAKESITINNGAVTFNDGFADLNFAIRKNVSGSAFVYDAGLDTMTMDASVFAMTGGIDATVTTGDDYYNIDAAAGSISLQVGGLGGQGTLLITGTSVALDLGTVNENVFTADGTGIAFNGDFQDLDFTVNKLTSGQAMLYDAGADALTLDADTATVNAATLLELNALLTDVKQTLRISQLNSGDEILTTDANGNVQESGIKATTAPAGGSGFTVVEYAVAPVNPPAGFLWMQAKDANTKTLNYYDGVQTYGVDLSV